MSLSLLLLTAALCTTQTGKLELTNVVATHGGWGPPRADLKLPVGDALHLAFDVAGLQTDKEKRVRFRTQIEVLDGKGKSIYQPAPVETVLVDLAGTGRMRHSIHVLTGLDQAPDTYKVKVTVLDAFSKQEATFTRDVILQPIEFSLVRLQITADRDGQFVAPPVGIVGQVLYVSAIMVGYKRDAKKDDSASLDVEMSLTDAQGKQISARPLIGEFKDVEATVPFVQFRFELPLQKAGQFKVLLKATDQVAKKSTTLSIPIQVLENR